MQTRLWWRLRWSLAESAFRGSLESGGWFGFVCHSRQSWRVIPLSTRTGATESLKRNLDCTGKCLRSRECLPKQNLPITQARLATWCLTPHNTRLLPKLISHVNMQNASTSAVLRSIWAMRHTDQYGCNINRTHKHLKKKLGLCTRLVNAHCMRFEVM
jgi:hypothetical protein